MDNRTKIKDKEEDWFSELPAAVRLGIIESIEQADKGEFISYEDVKRGVRALFEKK